MISRFFSSRWSPWWLLGLLCVLRLLYLPFFCSAYDLAGDESYYWAWGQRPDWCYFSKPPLIGWLMGLVGWATGNSEWGIRLAALLFGTASLAVLHTLAKTIFNEKVALLTLVLAALCPANVALHWFFTIDAPLVLCWSGALLLFWKVSLNPSKAWLWVLLTLVLGLGVLAKQMMLVFLLLMLIYAILVQRSLLRRVGFWACLLGALLFITPVLWWNQQHQWITLEHTSHHFDTQVAATFMDRVGTFLSYPASQMGLMSPLIWILLMVAGWGSLWRWKTLPASARYLVLFSAPALVLFLALALRQSINPNWPAVFYVSGMVLLAAVLEGTLPSPVSWLNGRWTRPTLIVAFLFFVATWLGPLVLHQVQPERDPLRRLRGWESAGGQLGALLQKTPRPAETFALVLGHRENASQFGFYTPGHPPVYRWQPDGTVASQYEIWPSAAERLGQDGLILQPVERPLFSGLADCFTSVEKLGDIRVPLGSGKERMWQVFVGKELKSWPPPVTRTSRP